MNPKHKEHVGLVNRQVKELAGIYRDAVKHLDISDSEFWVWYTLVSTDEAYTQQDICSMWSLPKQTVNSIITHLRLKKFAHKIPAADRFGKNREGLVGGDQLMQPCGLHRIGHGFQAVETIGLDAFVHLIGHHGRLCSGTLTIGENM